MNSQLDFRAWRVQALSSQASRMKNLLTYLSLFFGIGSWALLALRLTPIFGLGLGSVFYFFPSAVLGLIVGIIARIRCEDKKLAKIAIWISALPFAVLMLLIALLMRPNAWQQ
jgi:hypothetical protein